MKVCVTVEMEFDKLPDDAARELARQIVEARGLNVSRVAVTADKAAGKVFQPKAGTPGAPLIVGGRRFVVWSPAENHKGKRIDLWVTPEDSRDGDATVYRYDGRNVQPFHGDGKACRASFYVNADYSRTEVPCSHASHARQAA